MVFQVGTETFSEKQPVIYQYLTYYISLASNNFKGTIINCNYQKMVFIKRIS